MYKFYLLFMAALFYGSAVVVLFFCNTPDVASGTRIKAVIGGILVGSVLLRHYFLEVKRGR